MHSITERKLFRHAPEGTRLFVLSGKEGKITTRPATGLPLPHWPDGRWCWELATYTIVLASGKLSLYNRGGTVGTYVSQISHLVRFCWRKNVAFHRLTDDLFSKFIYEITNETNASNGERMREDNAVIDIGRRCLDFLKFVGQLHRIEGLVDEDGCIRARKKSFIITAKNGASGITINYWHHNAFPPAGPKNKRHLIAQQLIDRLRRAAVTASASPYLRQRRLVLLRLLEKLGARRSEIVRITVQSVYDAIEMAKSGKRPFLRITTAKRRAGKAGTQEHFRLIPIELHELHFIRDFVKFYRAPIIEKWLLKNVDHGLLLISQNSGAPLSPDTVTLELHYLRIEAGIDGKAHPQMFRHRYITHALLRLIKAHNLKDRSQFEIMFRLDGFKKEVAELTGHKSIASLDSYIDWAFIELYQYDNSARSAIDAAGLRASIRSSIPELEELMRVLSPEQFNAEVLARLKAIEKDLECFEANAASDEALNRATSNK